jgi:hypothetical protein
MLRPSQRSSPHNIRATHRTQYRLSVCIAELASFIKLVRQLGRLPSLTLFACLLLSFLP